MTEKNITEKVSTTYVAPTGHCTIYMMTEKNRREKDPFPTSSQALKRGEKNSSCFEMHTSCVIFDRSRLSLYNRWEPPYAAIFWVANFGASCCPESFSLFLKQRQSSETVKMQVTITLNPNLMLRVTSLSIAICAGVHFEFCVLRNRRARCGSSMIFQGFVQWTTVSFLMHLYCVPFLVA